MYYVSSNLFEIYMSAGNSSKLGWISANFTWVNEWPSWQMGGSQRQSYIMECGIVSLIDVSKTTSARPEDRQAQN